MATKKETKVKTYEVAVKNRKPFTIAATRATFGTNDSDLKFFLQDELVFAVHRQKWDYVRLVVDEGLVEPNR